MNDIGPSLLSELDRYRAQLEVAQATITILDTENAELHTANRDLNDEVHGLRQALADMARQRDDARDLAVRSSALIEPGLTRADLLSEQVCWAVVGSRPTWMSPDQYDPCNCRLPKGHDPVDGPGTLDGHCCGAHSDDHDAAIERYQTQGRPWTAPLVDPDKRLFKVADA